MTKAGESNAYDNKIIIVSHYCHFQSTLENNYENDFPFYGIIFVKVLCCNFIPFGNRKKNHFQARYRPQNHFSRKSTYLEHNSYKTYINSHILHINSNQFRQPEVNFVRNIISKPRFEAVRSQGWTPFLRQGHEDGINNGWACPEERQATTTYTTECRGDATELKGK